MAFGKKHIISDDIFTYNIGLIGESGIGKSTVLKNFCEKTVGENGYIMLDMGKEDGHSAINGIVSEPCPTFEKFAAVIKDIVENKESEYPDLRVVVIDTFDELCVMTEAEIVLVGTRSRKIRRALRRPLPSRARTAASRAVKTKWLRRFWICSGVSKPLAFRL